MDEEKETLNWIGVNSSSSSVIESKTGFTQSKGNQEN
jgi:YidC/Oxa1 family membrane protein insertase